MEIRKCSETMQVLSFSLLVVLLCLLLGCYQEIVCTLRGSNSDPVRLRVVQWVAEYAKARGLKNYIAGQVNAASR
jgi:hypothetical protein